MKRSQKYESVGESQAVLIMNDPSISTHTRIDWRRRARQNSGAPHSTSAPASGTCRARGSDPRMCAGRVPPSINRHPPPGYVFRGLQVVWPLHVPCLEQPTKTTTNKTESPPRQPPSPTPYLLPFRSDKLTCVDYETALQLLIALLMPRACICRVTSPTEERAAAR